MYREKIVSWKALKKELKNWQKQGLKIVFTNGCFDILHIGHVRYLEAAKKCGDKLIVAINSDYSVRKIKGNQRPIMSEKERTEIIASLESVDRVVIFNDPTPLALIKFLTILQKGGEVKTIPLIEGVSTSNIIERILKKFNKNKKIQ